MEGDKVRLILAENIKLYRSRRNWSQADLAEKSGLSIVYLSDIERCNRWPYLDTLVKLAEAFEVEIFELLKPQDTIPADTTSILTRYNDETTAIIEKALENMKKNLLHSLMNLKSHITLE
jgi:transcriptional regulator with XRE-family HTH domain